MATLRKRKRSTSQNMSPDGATSSGDLDVKEVKNPPSGPSEPANHTQTSASMGDNSCRFSLLTQPMEH